MCLYIKAKDCQIAKEDITAYAVRVYNSHLKIYSPIKPHLWEIGKLEIDGVRDTPVYNINEEYLIADLDKEFVDNSYTHLILDGAFHLFKDKNDAEIVFDFMKEYFLKNKGGVLLVEHIIPKGSQYYEGMQGGLTSGEDESKLVCPATVGYAAKQTILTKILDECVDPEYITINKE